MNSKARRPGYVTLRTIGHGNLMDHLFIIQGHDELVGLLVVGIVNTSVGHGLVHEGKVESFVVLVKQQPIIKGAWLGSGEWKSDHIPAVTFALPLPWKILQRPQVVVTRLSNRDSALHGLKSQKTFFSWHCRSFLSSSHPVWT